MRKEGELPELLAPAGSPAAVEAALEGGADAVYFGGPAFHARMRAQPFTEAEFCASVALCHAFGAKAYITLNTLVTDRELPDFLRAAELAARAGADALIVADLGGAAALRRAFPEIPLHASTQAGGHSIAAGRAFAALGFSRVVIARELAAPDIAAFVRESGVETEVFLHGALCVSASGQCLFSSLVGGRSGNRGACAQPCRLPDAGGNLPLSLKDLCLAPHIPALIEMGIDSLKIEGRLKPPAYVHCVTAVYRRLLDERRAATKEELDELAAAFSRGGFTDAYFRGQPGHAMLGARSEADKERSRTLPPFAGLSRRAPLDLSLTMRAGEPLALTAHAAGKTVRVTDDPPLAARTAPMDETSVRRSLCRLGGTPFAANRVEIALDAGLMVPVSRLNALRRAALDALTAPPAHEPSDLSYREAAHADPKGARISLPSARFAHPAQITRAAAFFPRRYLPLEAYTPAADGVVLPPLIPDSETDEVRRLLAEAVRRGARHALVANLGHLPLAREAGLCPHGDFRLNVTNRAALDVCLSLGFADVLLSPELTLPQIRDFTGACDVIVYGRIPLMVLEKCVGREIGSCRACAAGENRLVDRRGESFPVLRTFRHRSLVCNSLPTAMTDRRDALAAAGVRGGHYLFTVESPAEVDALLDAVRRGAPLGCPVRRIPT